MVFNKFNLQVIRGIVTKAAGNLYTVRFDKGEKINCVIKGNLRIKGYKSTNPVVVGDHVLIDIQPNKELGQIHEILERKNYIIRKSPNLSKLYHIIAANVDLAILVVTITEPETSTDFIDRYFVSCEALSIRPVLVINKIDLCTGKKEDDLNKLYEIYCQIGYTCIKVSVKDGYNIDVIKNLIEGKVSVLNGHSGVGKSSIIKAIAPKFDIKIGEISDYHKMGMHITSYSEMYEILPNTFIIDTPGIKGYGLIDIQKSELYHFFPEIFQKASQCKFYNCTHIHEPQCAVIEAVKKGEIALSRYDSYLNIYFDRNEKYR